jgi:hypothetical protein
VNDFGIKANRTYNVKNIAAHLGQTAGRRDTLLWGAGLTGGNILSNGIFVGLNAIPGSDAGAWTAAPYEAKYLKLYDTTAPAAVGGSVSNSLSNGSYAITNQATFNWAAVAADSEGIVPQYKVNVSVNGAPATNTVIASNSFTYTAAAADTKVELTVQAVNPTDNNSASAATTTNTAYLLTASGDYNGDGINNQTEINNGSNPLVGKTQATVTLGGLLQAYTGTARSATATTAPPGLTVNFTYNGSATAPTNPGTYAVTGTISDAAYAGTASGILVVHGPTPAADSVTKTNNTTQHRYSFAALLANDTRVTTNGTVLTNSGLSVVGATAGAGNSVSTNSSFIFLTPSTNSVDTFTYRVTDGTSTNTATVTVTLAVDTNVVYSTLQLIGSGFASFDGVNTTITNFFIGVPNQTYGIEYKGELTNAVWDSAGPTNSGPSGSFGVHFQKSGNHAVDWNGSMFFRGYLTNTNQ